MNDDLDERLQELLAERGTVRPDAIDRALSGIDALPERKPTRRSMPLAAAAVVAVAVIGLALAVLLPRPADVATPSPSPSMLSQAPSPSAAVITPEPTPTEEARPVWAMDLASHLDCDGPPSTIGVDVPPVPEPFDPGETPDRALSNILLTYWNLPASGYEPVLVDGHWALHRYFVDGRPKVHVVSTNEFPDVPSETRWEVVGLRACDQSEFADAEFGPMANTIWSDAAGDPVRTDRILSHAWPAHCFDKRTVLLSLNDPDYTQYVRDPSGDLERSTIVPYAVDVRLPKYAVDTGLHTDDWHLFTIPSRRAVFVRASDGTYELWPRASQQIGCL
jgi:hypothetical protein